MIDNIGIFIKKRPTTTMVVIGVFSLYILYNAIGYYYKMDTLSYIKQMSIDLINSDLNDNDLPKLLDKDKQQLEYTINLVEDNIFILLVKVRVPNLAPRDYFFLVKRYSKIYFFDSRYHVVLLELKTSPELKLQFTKDWF